MEAVIGIRARTLLFALVLWAIPYATALAAPAAIVATYSGSWFNATQSGHGFFVQILGAEALIAWFVFDNEGDPYWLVGTGPISENGFTVTAVIVEGGQFPPNFDPSVTNTVSWGSIRFEFTDCDHATVFWLPTLAGFDPGSLALTRLSAVDGLDCSGPSLRLADVAELADIIVARHPGPFSNISEAAWEQRLEAARVFSVQQIPDRHFPIALAELLASIGDAHTTVNLDQIASFHRYPIRLERVKEGLMVRATTAEYSQLLGSLLLAVDGVSIDDVGNRLARVISHENQHWVDARVASYVLIPELLEYLGVTAGLDRALLKFEDTDHAVAEISVATHLQGENLDWLDVFEQSGQPPPLYLQRSDSYWFQYLSDSGTLYLGYQQAVETPGYTFQQYVDDVVDVVNREDVRRLVLDLRRNTGGNAALAEPLGDALFSGALQPFNTPDGLFAIGGRHTFSSGLNNLILFGDLTNGTTIGMPSGGKPNHFGEVQTAPLSQSGILIQYSTGFFSLISDDSLETFTPTILVDDPTREMFLAGRDPVLEHISSP